MEPAKSSDEDPRIKQFWHAYLETIQLFRIPEKMPWVRLPDRKPVHVEQWLNQWIIWTYLLFMIASNLAHRIV
ncbi:MAG: hypothetical protein GY779_00435, partial [Gammaproteobacteria bacterium]|nr:hypothetical protein [Gammaproteobacteria bacterium]